MGDLSLLKIFSWYKNVNINLFGTLFCQSLFKKREYEQNFVWNLLKVSSKDTKTTAFD